MQIIHLYKGNKIIKSSKNEFYSFSKIPNTLVSKNERFPWFAPSIDENKQ